MGQWGMGRWGIVMTLGGTVLLLAGQADAQWRYTDDKGTTRVTQYKIDVPSELRDGAEWIGPVGPGKPGLSEDQHRAAQRAEANRRIIAAEAGLVRYRNMPAAARPAPDPGGPARAMATMCIAGQRRVMTSPGSWKVTGSCSSDFSTGYNGGYPSYGGWGGYPTH
jgi:hypothetical protein